MSISVAIDKWRNILKEAGAEWEYTGGDFCALHTLSGKVSDYYFNSEVVSAAPELLSGLCRDIYLPEIERRKLQIDLVVSYRPFGAAFADELSKKLGVESCFLRSLDSPSLDMEMKRHTRVLVVADDIYSGSSITKTIQAVRAQRGLIAPVLFVFGNFSGQVAIEGLEIFATIRREVKLFEKFESPLVLRGVRPIKARANWDIFAPSTKG